MFITAVCVIFLIKLRWPKSKSLYVNLYVLISFHCRDVLCTLIRLFVRPGLSLFCARLVVHYANQAKFNGNEYNGCVSVRYKIVCAFSLVERSVEMRVCKHAYDVTLSVFPRHNLKPFQSRLSNSKVQMLRNSNEEKIA